MTRDLTVNTIYEDKHCLDCKLLKFRKNLSQLCRSKLKLVDDHKTQPTDIRIDRNSLSSSVGSNVDHNSDETGSCGFEPHRVRDFFSLPVWAHFLSSSEGIIWDIYTALQHATFKPL